jgi:putative restriction endonuclease
MPKASSVKWTREALLIALNLYCKLPFGQLDHNNPVIREVASRLGRTSSSLSMKLCNFASLDPLQKARGVAGLTGASKLDRAMWDEFRANSSNVAAESEQLLHDLFTTDNEREVDFLRQNKIRLEVITLQFPPASTDYEATIRARRGQQFFRQAVLIAYGVRCCISGINVPRLLVASHIKPWRDSTDARLNPRNGLCLSSLHDAAFDSGLITIDEGFRLVISKRLKAYLPQPALEQTFLPYEGKPIHLPDRLTEPDPAFLLYHREKVFSD